MHSVGGFPDGLRRDRDDLCQASNAHLRDDSVAHRHTLDSRARFQDGPGHVHPRHIGQARLLLVEALRLKRIGVLNARIVRQHQDVSRLAFGPGYLVQRQDVSQRVGRRNRFTRFIETCVTVAANSFDQIAHDARILRGSRPGC